eukprot:m.135275 g.135275  ORF g.135275 m.135275 type:complete len:231 (-) comp9886_c0_seq1:1002-1694(-)
MSLQEEDVLQKTRAGNLDKVKHLNCWGSRLTDASLLKRMPNVEVITLSMNKLTSLSYFDECYNLRELYLRKNKISDINEIGYLMGLENLTILWISDNPVATAPNYRHTVIRNLPKLEKLDNIDVTDDERSEAKDNGDLVDQKTPTKQEEHNAEEDDDEEHGLADSDVPCLTETIAANEGTTEKVQRPQKSQMQPSQANDRTFEAVKMLLPLLSPEQLKELRVIAKRQLLL